MLVVQSLQVLVMYMCRGYCLEQIAGLMALRLQPCFNNRSANSFSKTTSSPETQFLQIPRNDPTTTKSILTTVSDSSFPLLFQNGARAKRGCHASEPPGCLQAAHSLSLSVLLATSLGRCWESPLYLEVPMALAVSSRLSQSWPPHPPPAST